MTSPLASRMVAIATAVAEKEKNTPIKTINGKFYSGMTAQEAKDKGKSIYNSFKYIDKDKDGKLSRREIKDDNCETGSSQVVAGVSAFCTGAGIMGAGALSAAPSFGLSLTAFGAGAASAGAGIASLAEGVKILYENW